MNKRKCFVSLFLAAVICFVQIGCMDTDAKLIKCDEHDYDAGSVYKLASCAQEGLMVFTCKACSEKKSEVIAKLSHNYNEGIVIKQADCGTDGEKRFTCTRCEHTKTETIQKTENHIYNDGEVIKASSCVDKGEILYTCGICGSMLTEEGEIANVHKFGEWETKAATCTAYGIQQRACADCKETESKQLPKLPHVYGEPVIIPPTRLTDGSSTVTCLHCTDNVVTKLSADSTLPLSAQDLLTDMGAGWNLGNSLDAYSFWSNQEDVILAKEVYADKNVSTEDLSKPENAYIFDFEQVWGNPIVTDSLIKSVKAMGFKTIRLPVTWYEHIDKNNKIDPVFMARVKQIAEAITAEGMYCILNIHHDGHYASNGWLTVNEECAECNVQIIGGKYNACSHEVQRFEKVKIRFQSLWTQITKAFRLNGEKLLFASMNEVAGFLSDYIIGGTANSAQSQAVFEYCLNNINILNEMFVKTVRSAGDYNTNRFLFVPTYYTIGYDSLVAQNFKLPADSKNSVIAEVHAYAPWNFVGENTEEVLEWSEGADGYNTARMLDDTFIMFKSWFLDRNIPLMIGEWGSCNMSDKLSGAAFTKRQEDRAKHAKYFMRKAKEYGIASIVWDDGGEKNYLLIDRTSGISVYKGVTDAIVNAFI